MEAGRLLQVKSGNCELRIAGWRGRWRAGSLLLRLEIPVRCSKSACCGAVLCGCGAVRCGGLLGLVLLTARCAYIRGPNEKVVLLEFWSAGDVWAGVGLDE